MFSFNKLFVSGNEYTFVANEVKKSRFSGKWIYTKLSQNFFFLLKISGTKKYS